MSRYIVRVVGPSGAETYLFRGREISNMETASRYPHPSNAWQAADAYRQKAKKLWPCNLYLDVLDTRNPEARVAYE